MSSRKRRRDQAFTDEELEPQIIMGEDSTLIEKQRSEKEKEVWDAIREAHYEAIEQLPLTLERQLSLMRKLDEQSLTLNSRLFPTLQRYIRQRQAMSEISGNEAETSTEQDSSATADNADISPVTQTNGQPHANGRLAAGTPFRGFRNGTSRYSPRTSTPGSVPPELQKDPESTRELLSHVAWISEELIRASQEKVNLAQTNHDSVERHIRLLDQAIKEQAASLSLEKSRLTTGIAVHLPDLVIPEWAPRKNRNTLIDDDDDDEANEGQQASVVPEPKKSRSKGSQRNSKKKGKERNTTVQDDQTKDSTSLTITLPATTQQDDIDLNEELYCYCNRVSFGDMIACDNESCEREWFHLGCVGLTEIPEGEWYCEDCRSDEA